MNQFNSNTNNRKHKHLNEFEIGEIYALKEAGKSVSYIAAKLNKSRGTIYNEIRRGSVIQIKQNKPTITYLPDVGQAVYDKNRKNSRRSSKVGKCKEFIDFAMNKFFGHDWSFDAIVGYCQENNLFENIVCTKTLYNYADKGLIDVKNIDLPCKLARSAKRAFSRENKKRLGKSIAERPDYINYREEFGHWELDTVVGKKTKDQKVIFSLVERKTRFYIPLLIESKNSSCVNKAFKSLIANFGDKFSQVFKSVTCDNGSEFSDMYLFDHNIPVYFAHPYSSYERGTNERHNALLRRYLPKSKSMNRASEDDIRFLWRYHKFAT